MLIMYSTVLHHRTVFSLNFFPVWNEVVDALTLAVLGELLVRFD